MSLQSRLFLLFVAIVVVPLSAASLLGQRVILGELEKRTHARLKPALAAATSVYEEKVTAARERVELVPKPDRLFASMVVEQRYADVHNYIRRNLGHGMSQLDFVVVSDPDGKVLAQTLSDPEYLPGVTSPTAQDIAVGSIGGKPPSWRLLVQPTIVPIRPAGRQPNVAQVTGGYYFDNEFLRDLMEGTELDATVVFDGRAIASTLRSARTEEGSGAVSISPTGQENLLRSRIGGQDVYAVKQPVAIEGGTKTFELFISVPEASIAAVSQTIKNWTIIVLMLTVVVAGLLGFWLARTIARPLRALAAGSNAIAAGNYDQHIEVRSRDEIGQLARSFNEMAQRLSLHVAELRDSREELKRALSRFGQTLRATHDLGAILQIVFDTSMDTVRAKRGALMLMTESREALQGKLSRGLDPALELKVGEGVAGHVAESGRPARVPGEDHIRGASAEPDFHSAVSVPLFAQERVMGVVTLYDKEDGQGFTEPDLGTLISLADQAGVAIENVFLHETAKRLAITDGLTGIWNRRYFQMRFEQEMERSARFGRPFSLVICDVDDFKSINDRFGHPQGDSVLIELAARLRSGIRDIDVFARYGGEEFVLILPETDAEGAFQLGDKIRRTVAATPFGERRPVEVTISVGVACFPEHGSDERSLEAAADAALYEAKTLGKNRVVVSGWEKVPGIASG